MFLDALASIIISRNFDAVKIRTGSDKVTITSLLSIERLTWVPSHS